MKLFFGLLSVIFLLSVVLFVVFELKKSKGDATGGEDFLLILGCRVRGTEAEETLKMRCERAAEYLKENKSTVAVACGGIVHEDQEKSEAQAIFELLTERGIDPGRIILEDKSRTTVENFFNAAKIIGDSSCVKLALLSSEFHLFRAQLIGKKCGLSCKTVAAPSPKKEKLKNYIREYFALIIFFVGGK